MSQAAKILLVDDEPLVLEMFQSLLASHGYDVAAVSSEDEAFQLAERFRFDVLVCDVLLSNLNGFIVAQTLEEEERIGGAVLITGRPNQKDASLAHDLNYGYLAKPVRFDLLNEEIQHRLRKAGQPRRRKIRANE